SPTPRPVTDTTLFRSAVDGERLPSLAPMLERVTPAVVNIATKSRARIRENPLFQDPFFRRFFDLPEPRRPRPAQSLGSGVIVDRSEEHTSELQSREHL